MNRDTGMARAVPTICGMALTLVLGGPALAQSNNSRRASDVVIAMKDLNLRDSQVRSLEISKDEAKGDSLPKAAPQIIEQVKQDFGRIQEVNSEIMRSYSAGEPPNYKHLSEAMAEINKRASRLNTNLLLPEPSAYEAPRQGDRSPLLDLNDLITRFVTSPIFSKANTINAEQGAKAKRDLADIIDLSSRIRKSAEKLSKSTARVN
jgi:hypothetical protein